MFCWTDDMISFMQDAANFGSYQQELAELDLRRAPGGKTCVRCGLRARIFVRAIGRAV